MDRIKVFLLALAFAAFATISCAPRVQAAALPNILLTQPSGVLRAGDTIMVRVSLDSAGQNMNALKVVLKYSSTFIRPVAVSKQTTFWPLWPQEPSWDDQAGTITLMAGHPNGLIAMQAPVADITFKVETGGLTQLVVDQQSSGMYLNDNLGTRVALSGQTIDLALADSLVSLFPLDATTSPTPNTWSTVHDVHIGWAVEPRTEYSYLWSTDSQGVPDGHPQKDIGSIDYRQLADGIYFFNIQNRTNDGVWSRVSQYRFQIDTTPPPSFHITKLDPRSVGGTSVISWDASDATSGIASTHLLVGKKDIGLVRSPLQLNPDWAGSVLTVVVRDQAGNERRASWTYPGVRRDVVEIGWVILGALVLIGAAILIRRRKR